MHAYTELSVTVCLVKQGVFNRLFPVIPESSNKEYLAYFQLITLKPSRPLASSVVVVDDGAGGFPLQMLRSGEDKISNDHGSEKQFTWAVNTVVSATTQVVPFTKQNRT